MKTRWKILLAALVIGIIAFAFLMPGGSYRRELALYKRELQAKGEKITLAELAPPRSNTNMSLGAVMFMAMTNLGPNNPADYRTNIQKTAALRAALAGGFLDFNPDYSMGAELPVPYLPQFKRAQQTAAATTAQALAQKDYPEAWADVLVVADLVRLHKNEPIMISDLVRIADLHIAVPVTFDAIEANKWSDAQLADLQTRWDDMNLFANAPAALAMEWAVASELMVQARASRARLNELAGNVSMNAANSSLFNTNSGEIVRTLTAIYENYRFGAWRSTWSYDEELAYLQFTTAAHDTARQILQAGALFPAYSELTARFININSLHNRSTNHFMLYQGGTEIVFTKYITKLADAEAYRRLFVTAIALKRYQLAHGANPNRLEDLVPEYLQRVPVDFIDGKPLRYRLNADGDYLLYSVGLDGKDDGGNNDRVWPRPVSAAKQ